MDSSSAGCEYVQRIHLLDFTLLTVSVLFLKVSFSLPCFTALVLATSLTATACTFGMRTPNHHAEAAHTHVR